MKESFKKKEKKKNNNNNNNINNNKETYKPVSGVLCEVFYNNNSK